MPHKNDTAPYKWPKGTEEAWFTQRTDVFPNGTSLPLYPPRILQNHVKQCLDKITNSQLKFEKK